MALPKKRAPYRTGKVPGRQTPFPRTPGRKLKIVDWVDSGSLGQWRDPASVDNEPVRCTTVGFVMHEDKKAITLAQSICPDQVNAVMTIPRGCIKSVRGLK